MTLQLGPVRLRAVERDDVPQLHLWQLDHGTWHLAEDVPYTPLSVAAALKRFDDGKAWCPDDKCVPFVVEAAGDLAGHVCLWGMDSARARLDRRPLRRLAGHERPGHAVDDVDRLRTDPPPVPVAGADHVTCGGRCAP
jgi:hypothetical protein